ncbi:MAG: T9SS type A sorting domain-containing protein [Chitinophagales bacterium]|nr:T9SS type A sorting domain-containing protein [Chitinophagales bacterium]
MRRINFILKGVLLLFLCVQTQAQKVDFVAKKYPINNSIGIPYSDDLNGDGKLDIIQTHFKTDPRDKSTSYGLYISYNQGNFVFSAKLKLGNEFENYDIRNVIDVNADGKRDMVLRKTWDSLGIAIQIDSLNFVLFKFPAYYPNPYDLKYADMDGNGKLDIVFMQSAGKGPLKIVYQIDSLVFADKPSLYSSFKIANNYDIGDFNQDGKMDLVYFENIFGTSIMHIYTQRDSGIYNEPTNYLFSNSNSVRNLCIADINNDGRDDIAVAYESNFRQRMAYRLQDSLGLFPGATKLLIINDTLPVEYLSFTIKKLNCKNTCQLIWYDKSKRVMTIIDYHANGSWTLNNQIFNSALLISDPHLSMGDYDGDGKLDFFDFIKVPNYKTNPLTFFDTLKIISNHTLPDSFSLAFDSIHYDTIPDAYSDGVLKVYKLQEYVSSDTTYIRKYGIVDGVMMDRYTIYKKYYYVEYNKWTCIQDTIYQVKGEFCGDSIQDTIVRRTTNERKVYLSRDTTKVINSWFAQYYLPTVFGAEIVKANQSSSINLYPNPTSAEINIEGLDEDINPVFKIYDVVGKNYEINEIHMENKVKLDVSNLPAGIYFLQIIQGAHIQSKRVEIVK